METDNVRVGVRVRPLNHREIENGCRNVVKIRESQATLFKPGKKEQKPRIFNFDCCFDSSTPNDAGYASQETVFDILGKDILINAFKGYNACLFAYGQTGSGKSFTMMGSEDDPGIIPRLCQDLFREIERKSKPDSEVTVEVSYMEIYNEKVYDLLDLSMTTRVGLKVREHNILGPYVEGLAQLAVISAQEIDDLMIEGNKSRTIAATKMNSESSRSHAVFTIIITFTIKDEKTGVTGEKVSRVSLVDLAGSERANKTGAVGDRLKEGSNINKSLTTLGLVISKLADRSSGKTKDSFVPYRDSVLTWLLKDSLGGNSKTVMVATLSPAEENYEETLSTMRYADRAKSIKNHAVINEDPNARLISELRAEVEQLKSMLLNAAQPDLLREKLLENEKLMNEMSLTWSEKLAKTGHKQEENRQALASLGLANHNSNERSKFFLVNLNSDPALNEVLVYYLKEQTRVGSPSSPVHQDIQLTGAGIQEEHCTFIIQDDRLYIEQNNDARTFVNGKLLLGKSEVWDGDRILLGTNHFFRVNCPSEPSNEASTDKLYSWSEAQEEVVVSNNESIVMRDAIMNLQKKYEADKLAALESQRKEYENQIKTIMEGEKHQEIQNDENVSFWLSSIESNRSEIFKNSLEVLHDGLMKAVGVVREANQLSEDLKRNIKYSITLQIPATYLSPNYFNGTFMSEPRILVQKKDEGRQVWSMDKMESKIIDMREMHHNLLSEKIGIGDSNDYMDDPFFDTVESHSLIGVANLYLTAIFHDIPFEYYAPIITQEGKVAGKLLLQVSKIEGSPFKYTNDNIAKDTNSEANVDKENYRSQITLKIKIRAAVGIPPSLSHFLFCQYKFYRENDYTVVPSMTESKNVRTKKIDTMDFRFEHERDISLHVDEEFIEFCEDGTLSVEVYGHKEKGFFSIREAKENMKKAQVLADRYSIAHPDLCWICFDMNMKCHHVQSRWSELVRKLEVWVEIHEMNDQGFYVPVEIQHRNDVGTGGIYQLRQGQQRRIAARIKPVQNSGNFPIVLDSIVSIEVGNPVARSKLQLPLDSYQEEDLRNLRSEWATEVARLKDEIDKQIHNIDNKIKKSCSDLEYEQSLIDKKNCIVEELNANLIPGEASNGTLCFQLGMEKYTPVLFMNLTPLDTLDTTGDFDEFLPVIGEDSILPKEKNDNFFSLPIIEDLENIIGSVASWDSSIQNSVYLNRATQEHERLFLIIRITLRVTDPQPLDLILRKRICFSVYRRHSIVSKFRKSFGYSNNNLIKATGVTYEITGKVPRVFMASTEEELDVDDTSNNTEATFLEQYTQAVIAVETILNLERMKQKDLLSEILSRNESQHRPSGLTKTLSLSSLPASRRSLSLLNLSSGSGNLSGSMRSLNQEFRNTGRRSFEVTQEQRKAKRLSMPAAKYSGVGVSNRRSMVVLTEEDS